MQWKMQPGELRRVTRLALPLILCNLTQPALIATDTFLAGRQPSAAVLGGVTVGGMLFNALFWSFGFLRMATTGLVAQASGAQDERAAALHATRALLLALAAGTVLLALQHPLLTLSMHWMGASPVVTAEAYTYCSIVIWSAPASLANYAILGTLLGQQRARLALLLQGAIQVISCSLAFPLVLWFHQGITGLGTATLVSEWAGCLLGIATLRSTLRLKARDWKPLCDTHELRKLFTLNLNIFLRTICLVSAFNWFTHQSAVAGDTLLAANALLLTLLSIASYGLDGFVNATEALVGEAVGARNRAQFRSVLVASTLCAVLMAAGFSVTFALAGVVLIPFFAAQQAVQIAARHALPWLVVLPLVAMWGYQLDGIFLGATRSRELRNSMGLALAGFLLLSALFVPRWQNDGLWMAFLGFMVLRGITLGSRVPALVRSISGLPQDAPQSAVSR
jgi:MATE family multidrug resistance protein